MNILSFDNFGSHSKNSIREKRSVKRQKRKLNENKFKNKINENSFQVGDDYKVKITIDLPISLVKEYIEKVQNETNKNPLDNFSESELAEQMVNYIIKNNLNIDNLPYNFSVGDEIDTEDKDETELENETDLASNDVDKLKKETETETVDDSDGLINMTDDDINFEGDEIELGEEIEIDENDKTEKEKKKESEEEEESLDRLYKKIGYTKTEDDMDSYSSKPWYDDPSQYKIKK